MYLVKFFTYATLVSYYLKYIFVTKNTHASDQPLQSVALLVKCCKIVSVFLVPINTHMQRLVLMTQQIQAMGTSY